ncbi:MAG: hypothetical protein OK457_11055 [Thaumarchaeota archaeon]|nr:hypothetical protein [Nitrososphaerota archaeon]
MSLTIGKAMIESREILSIEETISGYIIRGSIPVEADKKTILEALALLKEGSVENSLFVTDSGKTVNEPLRIEEMAIGEREFPEHKSLTFVIRLIPPRW